MRKQIQSLNNENKILLQKQATFSDQVSDGIQSSDQKTTEDFDVELPQQFHDKPSILLYNFITAEVIMYGMSVMGGMASVFERQSAVQKWEDMHSPIQIGRISISTHSQQNAIAKLSNVLS